MSYQKCCTSTDYVIRHNLNLTMVGVIWNDFARPSLTNTAHSYINSQQGHVGVVIDRTLFSALRDEIEIEVLSPAGSFLEWPIVFAKRRSYSDMVMMSWLGGCLPGMSDLYGGGRPNYGKWVNLGATRSHSVRSLLQTDTLSGYDVIATTL